jgi:23S rRNA U2552 (ribose-2'-O)-methylase RlmE/FtsJ
MATTTATNDLRSKAYLKLKEIDRKTKMFSKLAEFEKGLNNNNNIINLYSAVDFGAAPGGFAKYMSQRFYNMTNNNINLCNSVVTVDNRDITPALHNTIHIRGSVEEHRTFKRVQEAVAFDRFHKRNDPVLSSKDFEFQKRLTIVTNDTVAILRGNFFLPQQQQHEKKRKYSVTYAQNNLVLCCMRRSFELLDCFKQQHDDKTDDSVTPPCFFISKILRSIHINRVVRVAEKYFDSVQLLSLESSTSDVERYLVAEKKSSEKSKKIIYRDLTLPPEAGEAKEWTCWGCLQTRSGECLRCPACEK